MARTTESSSSEEREPSSPSSELTVIEAIQKIAHYNANAELDNEYHLTLFLKSWWSRTYNRPLKDPLLESYTLEELLYEFYDRQERELAIETQVEQDTDRIDTKKVQENLDWAEEEERKELEALRVKEATQEAAPEIVNPLEDPDNKKWMEEQIKQDLELAKETFGSDFGEDIDEDFNG
jgi:hypothetical protein